MYSQATYRKLVSALGDINAANELAGADDQLGVQLGTDNDVVLLNRSTTLAANTALAGVLVGTPVVPALAANTGILANVTANGDILIAAQTGGNSSAYIWVDASASNLRLYAAGTLIAALTTTTLDVTGRLTTTDAVASGTVRVVGGRAYQVVAASTAITNTVTETAFSNGVYTIPADTLKASTSIRFRIQGIATATNATDTLQITVRLGAAGVAAQIVTQTIALDVEDNDIFVLDGHITIRTAGASGTMVAYSQHSIGAADTATTRMDAMASAAIDTTASRDLTCTATWSVADAGNSCRLDIMEVQVE